MPEATRRSGWVNTFVRHMARTSAISRSARAIAIGMGLFNRSVKLEHPRLHADQGLLSQRNCIGWLVLGKVALANKCGLPGLADC